MIVRMYMTRDVETISPDTTLAVAIQKMRTLHIRRLVVVSANDTIEGMVCQHDLITAFPHNVHPFSALALESSAAAQKVRSVMKSPVLSIDQNDPIEHAASVMAKHHVGGLPVTGFHKLVGIITESDIFRAFTTLLAGHGNSIRITFDITEDENILTFLDQATRKHRLRLRSFISFHDEDVRMAVVRVRGEEVQPFIADLWGSGHRVMNIVKAEEEVKPPEDLIE